MKRLVFLAAAVFSFCGSILAEQPPIIDRALFFGEIQIAGAQISPDGQYVSFLKPYKGTRNIWVKKASEPFSAARPMSAEATRPIRQYFWSRDAKYILYSQDAGGDENFNVYAIDPTKPTGRDNRRATDARADKPEGRTDVDLRSAKGQAKHSLHWPERSRQAMARSL